MGARDLLRQNSAMVMLTETATFRGDDVTALVEASLACRMCLSGEVDWSLRAEDWDAEVECRCRGCDDVRTVSLTGEQALRLSVDRRLGW
ncbi:MAG: hypothetical protein ACR2GL_07410 [Thermoleophilaceae bacterium]